MINQFISKIKKMIKKLIYGFKYRKPNIIEYDSDYIKKLNEIQPCPTGDIFADNNIEYKYDLQIIIPCYNVEEYVEDCILSVLNQKTKYKYIVILVNDGSTDNTLSILRKYENNEHVILINQENRGFSGARNRALKNIKAKYVAFLDSDDMLCDNSIECMLDTAFNNSDCDIIEGNYKVLKHGISFDKNIHTENSVTKTSTFYGMPWGKLYKAHLWKNYQFPEGYWFEDTLLCFVTYYQCNTVFTLAQYIYIYRINIGSISQSHSLSTKSIDSFYITELLMFNHRKLNLIENNQYLNKVKKQFIINMHRISELSENIKILCLCYMKNLLLKYFDSKQVESDDFFNSIIKLDFNRYLYYEKI